MSAPLPPRWAFERVEQERCAARGLVPNPLNIDVVIANPDGWPDLHAWAAFIARVEGCPRCSGDCGAANPPMVDCAMQPAVPRA